MQRGACSHAKIFQQNNSSHVTAPVIPVAFFSGGIHVPSAFTPAFTPAVVVVVAVVVAVVVTVVVAVVVAHFTPAVSDATQLCPSARYRQLNRLLSFPENR